MFAQGRIDRDKALRIMYIHSIIHALHAAPPPRGWMDGWMEGWGGGGVDGMDVWIWTDVSRTTVDPQPPRRMWDLMGTLCGADITWGVAAQLQKALGASRAEVEGEEGLRLGMPEGPRCVALRWFG